MEELNLLTCPGRAEGVTALSTLLRKPRDPDEATGGRALEAVCASKDATANCTFVATFTSSTKMAGSTCGRSRSGDSPLEVPPEKEPKLTRSGYVGEPKGEEEPRGNGGEGAEAGAAGEGEVGAGAGWTPGERKGETGGVIFFIRLRVIQILDARIVRPQSEFLQGAATTK